MEIETRSESGRPSPFSRPPQSRTPPSLKSSPTAARSAAPSTAFEVAQSQTTQPGIAERQALETRRRSGGQWFYWIAALSLINTALAVSGQTWRFILGLGITRLVQELGQGAAANIKAGFVGVAVIGLFAFLGHRAVQGYHWAFVVGMVLFALDGVIFLLIQDWAGVGFHAFALVMIYKGYSAARQLPRL